MKLLLLSIACSTAEVVTHPIDTVKTRLQIGSQTTVPNIVSHIFKEHGIQGFYKSLQPALFRHWIYSTGRVTIYERLKKDDDVLHQKIRNGCIAGGVSQFVASPMDLVKIRLQGNPSLNLFRVLQDIYQQEGMMGFYKGWQPNVGRAALVNIGELVAYDSSKKYCLQHGMKDQMSTHFLCSVYSGLCSTLLSTPADVIKSNFMNHHEKYNHSLIKCIYTLYQQHGLFYFWRGSLLNWVRLGPWQMVFWVTYENLAILTGNKTF